MATRRAYPGGASAGEWAFVAPYLTQKAEDAPRHEHSLWEAINGLRWFVRASAS